MDAITLLKNDHKTVEALFKRFERAGDGAHAEKREVVDKIIEELAIHAAVEEQLFYPVTRATVPETEDIALESLEEHHIVKWVLSELDGMDPSDERFDAKVTVLMENVRHHVEEEEDDYFPKVRDELGRNALNDLGDAMEAAKRVAPTHPHPRSPDAPPGNLVVGTAAGVVDRVGDTMAGAAQGGAYAIGDLIATVLRRKKPTSSPRGSSTARSTATKVRDKAAQATDALIEAATDAKESTTARTTKARRAGKTTARSASRGATKTAKAARSGAKATATSARKGAKRVATTAKRSASGARKGTTSARSASKATATSTRKAAKRTRSTAKRAATSTGRTARKATRSAKSTAKRATSR
ncbi:MAG: hemerythrin domain-containing protein [Acidimicrobiales bacterium]